jgi:hypothetical protein
MTTILTKKKDTAGAPAPGDLTNSAGGAELAVNTFDKRLYTKNAGGSVVEIGTNPSTIDTTTVDTTNLEVTNIKAKDGTASATIANSTGIMTIGSSVLTTTDINGGTIDGTVIGGASAAAGNFTTLGATGVATFSAGTVSAPAITTTGDTNTGIFFPAADTIAFTEGGVESMRIDSSGNLGLGVTPSCKLDVNGRGRFRQDAAATTGAIQLLQNSGDTVGGYIQWTDNAIAAQKGFMVVDTSSNMLFATVSTERMRIDGNGNVAIGTSTAYSKFCVTTTNGNFGITGGNTSGGNKIQSFGATVASDGYLAFEGNSSEWMRLTATGNLGIGTSSPNNIIEASRNQNAETQVRVYNANAGSSARAVFLLGNDASAGASGIYLNSSTNTGIGGVNSLNIYNGLNAPIAFLTNGTERMRIIAGGNVNMGAGLTTGSLTSGIRAVNFTTTEVCICPTSGTGTTTFLNVCDSAGSSGGSYAFVIRGLGSGGTAQVTLSSVQIDASTTFVNTLSKTGGSFRIPHPLPELNKTHDLVHSFVESPDANNIYRGVVNLVNGQATVNLDDVSRMTEGTFVVLNREVQAFVSNQSDWDAVKASVNGNMLTIQCQNNQSTASISWLVIGMRQDKYMFDTDWTDDNGYVITEPLKQPKPENDLPHE